MSGIGTIGPLRSLFPWIISVPLLMGSFLVGIFFTGTDRILFLPAIGGSILLGAIALGPGFQKGWKVPYPALLICVLCYWGYVAVSPLWSSVPYNSTLFALIFSLFPYLFLTGILAADRQKWLVVHLGAVGAVVAGFAVWALIQFFFFFDTYGPRIHHPMLNPNNLAAIFNICLFPAMGLFFVARQKSHQAFSFALVLLFLMALFVTQGRGALLAFAIALVPFLAFTFKYAGISWKKVLMLVLCGAALFAVANHETGGRLSKSVVALPTDKHSVVERQFIWGATLDMARDHFWTGTGLGTFIYNYPRYRNPKDMSDGYFAHMDPLQFWAEMGILAPILFYAILICVLVLTIRATRRAPPDSQDRLWVYASFCGLLTLAGHAHISFHLYMPPPLIMAGLLLAFWYDRVVRILGDETRTVQMMDGGGARLVFKALFVLLLVAPILWLSFAATGVHYAARASSLLQQGEHDEGYKNILLAQKYAPGSWEKPYDLQMRYRIYLLTRPGGLKTREERKQAYDEALMYASLARARNPAFASIWNRQAQVYFIAYPDIDPHGRAKAIILLKEALEQNPLLVDARLGLSRIYRSKGEIKKAYEVLKGAMQHPIPLSGASRQLYIDAADLSIKMGNVEEARRLIKQANDFAERIRARQQKR